MHLIKLLFTVLLLSLMIGCTTSEKNSSSKEKTNNAYPRSFAHGTAQIAGTIVSINEKNGEKIVVIKVNTVLGYGAGTRSIPSGVELEFKVNKSVDKQLLKENSTHNFTVRFMNERFGGEVDHPWEIIKVK